MSSPTSAELARYCATIQTKNLPSGVLERVRYLLLDHLAVTIRGSLLPSSLAIYQMVNEIAGESKQGVTVIAREERMEASWAVLANGTAAHGLGMDDVENQSSLHPGSVVFPTVLALTEQENLTADDFYAAVVAGYEATIRVGAALNAASTYERGFHPTALCGAMGSAVASARLLHLSPERTNMAMGIAGSMAAGSMAYLDEGAWTKRLHAGWVCHAGLIAARLAAHDFKAPSAILESPNGFLHAHSSRSNKALLERNAQDDFAIMGVSLKPYACCRYTHGPIDCLLDIAATNHLDLEQIKRISCGVLTAGRTLMADPIEQKRQVHNVVEAQSSMPFSAAIALVTGRAGISVFTDEWLQHPMVRTLMQRVECYSTPELDDYYPAEWRAAVSVEMVDGRRYYAEKRYALGDPCNPLTWEQLEERFHELTEPVIKDRLKRQQMIEKAQVLENVGQKGYFIV